LEDLLHGAETDSVLLTQLKVQPRPRLPRHSSLGGEVAPDIIQTLRPPHECGRAVFDGERACGSLANPISPGPALSVLPGPVSEEVQNRSKKIDPSFVGLPNAMGSMERAARTIMQRALQVSLQAHSANSQELGV